MPLDSPRNLDVRDLRRLLVLRNQLDQLLAVCSTRQLDQLRVLLADARKQVRVGDRIGLDCVGLEGELRDGLGKGRVAAGLEKCLVEEEIQPKDVTQATGPDCRAVLRMHALQCFHHFGGGRQRHHLDRGSLENLANEIDLLDFEGCEIANDGPAIGSPRHHSHQFQLGQYLTDNVPLDVEPGKQIVLDQALARSKKAESDLLLETLNDVVKVGRLGIPGDAFVARTRYCGTSCAHLISSDRLLRSLRW